MLCREPTEGGGRATDVGERAAWVELDPAQAPHRPDAGDDFVPLLLEGSALGGELHLALVLADELNLPDRVHQVAELGHRQLLVVDAASLVGHLGRDVRHQAGGLLFGEPCRQRLALVQPLQADRGHLKPLKEGGNLVGRLRPHRLDIRITHDPPQVLDLLGDLLADPERLGGELVLVQLGAASPDKRLLRVCAILRLQGVGSLLGLSSGLRGRRGGLDYSRCLVGPCRDPLVVCPGIRSTTDRLRVDRGAHAACVAGGAGLGGDEVSRAHVPQGHAGDKFSGNLLGGLEHHAHGLGGPCNVPQFHGHEPGAGFVVERLLHLGLLRLGGVHVPELAQHLGVRALGDRFLDGLGLEQGADHLVAAAVAERLGNHVRVQTVHAEHPVLARAEFGDVGSEHLGHRLARGAHSLHVLLARQAGIDCLHALDVQAVRSFNHDLGPIRVDELARPQVGHRPVQGFHAHGGSHLGGNLLALGFVLLLHVAQDAAAGVPQPLELAHARLVHVGDGRLNGLLLHRLIGGPLRIVHAALFLRLELRLHLVDGRLPLDLLVRGEHAVHDLAHLARQDREILAELASVDRVQVIADGLVHALEPRAEPLKHPLHLGARSLAFKQVDLEVVRKRLVVLALLVKRHPVPVGDALCRRGASNPEPPQQFVEVVDDASRGVGRLGHLLVERQECVRRLVQERGEVGRLV